MSTIVIGKYVGDVCVEELELPVRPLQFLAGLLPKQARRELERRGLNIDVLLNDTIPNPGAQWLDVKEKNVLKRVRIVRRTDRSLA